MIIRKGYNDKSHYMFFFLSSPSLMNTLYYYYCLRINNVSMSTEDSTRGFFTWRVVPTSCPNSAVGS